MKIRNSSLVACSSSLLAIALASVPALAQSLESQTERLRSEAQDANGLETAANDAGGNTIVDPEGNVIVVRGTRAALASALDRRRAAGTVSDSIIAEDVSNFPDKNIGEAVSRVPGVQLSRDFGEGAQVSIRGTAPELSRVEVNGMTALSSSGESSRATDFREFAAELVQSVDVFKGTTADMTEGGVGGTIRVRLREPLDLNGPLLVGNIAMQHQSTRGDWSPRVNVTGGYNWNDTFGLLVNVTYDDVKTRGDLARNTEWVRLRDFDGSTEKTVNDPNFANTSVQADCAGNSTCLRQWFDYSPRIPRYGLWTRDDERISAQVTAQWQAADNLDFTVDYNYNERAILLTDFNFVTELTSIARFARNSAGEYLVTVDDNHNVIAAEYANVDRMFSTEQRRFTLDAQSQYISGRANWDIGNLNAQFLAGISQNENLRRTNRALYATRLTGLRLEVDPDNGIPNIIVPENFNLSDPNNYNYLQLEWRPNIEDQEEVLLQADFDWEVDSGWLRQIEFGGQRKEYSSTSFGGGGYLDPETGGFVPTLNITNRAWTRTSSRPEGTQLPGNSTTDSLSVQRWYNTLQIQDAVRSTATSVGQFFPGHSLGSSLPQNWLAPDFDSVASHIVNGGVFDGQPLFDTSNFTLDQSRVTTANGRRFEQLPLDLNEEVSAFYVKGNFVGDIFGLNFVGNAGLRYVRTRSAATGVLETRIRTEDDDSTDATPQSTITTIGSSNSTVTRTYAEWLPSINANVELVDNQVFLRLGASRNMSRPPIANLRPSGSCTFIDPGLTLSRFDELVDTCSAGNPALRPFLSWNYDAEFAWYPTREAEVRLGFFYKDISSYVVGQATLDNVDFFGDGRSIRVTQPINGDGANNFGVEFSAQTPFTFLPAPFDGFGAQVNYTYSDATQVGLFSPLDGAELPQIGQSKHSFGIIGYYDKGPLNARVAYQYRSDFLVSPFDREGNSVFEDAGGYLDASIRYDLTRNAEIYVEGKNLTNETQRRTAGESDVRLTEFGWYGRRYFIGARIRY